jgi:hypothetical protein
MLGGLNLLKDEHILFQFVAMEYYFLILNRSFLILLTDEMICGAKVNGIVSVSPEHYNMRKSAYAESKAIKGDLFDPISYVKQEYINKLVGINIESKEFLDLDKENFQINRKDVIDVVHNPKKKWGMGYYPHDGRVLLNLRNAKQREFIILGNQSGDDIRKKIINI